MSQYDTSSVTSAKIESLEDFEDTPEGKRNRWISEIQYAEKEKETFCSQGKKVIKRFLDQRDDISITDRKFNIFYANVEILKGAMYANIPTVEVTRRFTDPNDDVARVAAMILQRNLAQDLDEAHCNFNDVVKGCVEDYLLPGLGVVWLRMETETEQQTIEAVIAENGAELVPAMEYEAVVEQEIYIDYVHWDDFLWSPCRVWQDCRWKGRKVRMTRDKLIKRFGEEVGKKIPLDYNPAYRVGALDNTPKNEVFQQATIYEIWDKDSKTAYWISKSYDKLLDEREDPLEIENFDPCPRPMMANTTTSNCVPKADFVLLQDQYNELDTVNTRIQSLIQACKVVGVYDRANVGIQRMLQEGVDNTLVPVDNWAMFAEKGGMKGVVDWLPLDQVVRALERLERNREDIKGQIYELTGIADIVRGSTKASETLGAQELKAQFANIKIQRRKEAVADFVTDILRIKAQLICKHFPDEMILKRANIEFTDDVQYAQAALELLRDHAASEWQIKIEPDSMSRADYAQDRQDLVEMLGVVTPFLEKMAAAIQTAPMIAPFMVTLLRFIVSKFRAGKDVESSLDAMLTNVMKQMQQPQPPKSDPAMVKVQAEVGAMQAKTKADIQAQAMKAQADIQLKQQKQAADIQTAQQEASGASQSAAFEKMLSLFKTVTEAEIKKDLAEAKKKESDDGKE